jgi:hypothetical protein
MARDDERDLVEAEDLTEDELAADEADDADIGSRGILGLLGGLVIGALIGAGVALLVAPERGDVTRRRLGRRVRELTADARDQIDGLRDGAEREVRRQKRRIRRRLRTARD